MSVTKLLFLAPLAALVAAACAASPEGDETGDSEDAVVATVTPAERTAVEKESLEGLHFDAITPSATHVMKGVLYWKDHQLEDLRYPQPRMCASNVSKVLYLGGIERYNAEAVYDLIRSVGAHGGELHRLPMPTAAAGGGLDKTKFLAELESIDHGLVPMGTLVAGCLTANCDAEPGEQHIAIVGETDADGTVWLWHNNWYRPDNENGQWKPWMVYSDDHDLYEKKHLQRQWMRTPWLKLTRDASGHLIGAESLVPAIDDLDPFGGLYGGKPKYHMTLAVIPEIASELVR